ncbi:MAG: glycosyltransferase family 4 protein [Anaerolineae bacterium]
MNVVFVSYTYWPPHFGGELLLAIERLQSLAQRGHRVTVLTSGRPGFPARTEDRGLRILRSPAVGTGRPARLLRRIVFFLWSLWYLRRLPCDVLHLGSMPGMDAWTDAVAAWAYGCLAKAKEARTVAVHALAESEEEAWSTRGLHGVWKSLYFRHVDHIVAVSPSLYEPLVRWHPDKAVLILYAVRDDIFTPLEEETRRHVRAEFGAGEGDVIFTFLGTVCRRKGFDLLAQAFAQLAPAHPDWHLWVIGPRTRAESQNLDEAEVREVTAPLQGLDAQVHYVGRVDDRAELARLLGAGDVFVFPSRREGFGLAPVEAMAAGVPVILARIPGVTDLANVEGETGLYVPPNDAEALRQAMERLGSDPALRRRMGQKAVQRVREAFSWEPYVDRWEDLYRYGRVGPEA